MLLKTYAKTSDNGVSLCRNDSTIVNHPEFGRGFVSMLTRYQACITFIDAHRWFDIDDLLKWKVENATTLNNWYRRIN
jgi:hypothetical protein